MNQSISENINNENILFVIRDKFHIFNINNNKKNQIFININLNNFNHNINFKTMLIKTINNNVYNDLFTRMFIKAIKNLVIQIIKTINNVYKHIKIIKKTLVFRYSPL